MLPETYLSVGLRVLQRERSFHSPFQVKLGLLDEPKELQLIPDTDRMDRKATEEMAEVALYLA